MIPIYNHNKAPLNEVTRWDILRRSQRESPVRFDKKKFYRAINSFEILVIKLINILTKNEKSGI